MRRVGDFEVKITRKKSEIEAAQRLRFEVFNLEMHKGLRASDERGLDIDPYDSSCEHLIVRDSKEGRIVGTYRLLLGSRTNPRQGFYSEQEFDLRRIKNLRGELLEPGRSRRAPAIPRSRSDRGDVANNRRVHSPQWRALPLRLREPAGGLVQRRARASGPGEKSGLSRW
jgi:putative hemolysin